MAGLAYFVDQHVIPAARRPAYDAVLPLPLRIAVYASLAATLTLRSALQRFGTRGRLGRRAGLG